jgi:hypothetical protein
MSSGPANPCNGSGRDYSNLEYDLFGKADEAVVQALNRSATGLPDSQNQSVSGPKARALNALTELEHLSVDVNNKWPEENRFHFEILDVAPALVVKMTYRNRATFTVFAIPERETDDKSNASWKPVYTADSGRFEPRGGYDSVDLFPLQRSRSNRARFLAKFGSAGCGSSVGISYYAYEWRPEGTGDLSEMIKQEGAVSQEEPVDERRSSKKDLSGSFPPVGEFRTNGPLISLPFCWFSSIDTWDNPSLCAVDSYDISGDRVRFVSRVINRPDLVPVAKVILYGGAHEYAEVLAYCGSPQVAGQIIRNVPPFVFAGPGLKVSSVGVARERVELGDEKVYRFEVEKRGDRWLVVAFQVD